jgi:hypothetical protein
MTRDEAYKTLGLVPLDEFLDARRPEERGIGATIWMLVMAAIDVNEGGHAVIVADSMDYADGLARKCLAMVGKLGGTVYNRRRGYARCAGTGQLTWRSDRSKQPMPSGVTTTYRDSEWKKALVLRRGTPEDRIYDVLEERGGFHAYDIAGEYLMELDLEGVEVIRERGR